MTKTKSYYFPVLFLMPGFEESEINIGHFTLSTRKWRTSTFDLATLATKHKLHLPYQAMDIFLGHCNLEICISNVETIEEAQQKFRAIQIALYKTGISPFLSPLISTHSINSYSGINTRDSGLSLDMLPGALRTGLKSNQDIVEVWPLELSFDCQTINEKRSVSIESFYVAGKFVAEWLRITASTPSLLALESAMIEAPKLSSRAQSILHIWTALESIFPLVTTEVSFRMALYMAQLNSIGTDRRGYHSRVKRAYNMRSKIAHGAKFNPEFSDWMEAWRLVTDTVTAIVRRGRLPNEEQLLDELLA
ncbi:HEPN domain-containing protein [Pseudomonas sp. MWU13-2517]|uniref:HEPN domain-containing protein n=1 Tax=Pseudomonas sp. MWU13-2517 TaxID=2929055 RepID=UPI00200EF83A|nr:HEPN domain-containing protein [Pseudomonas sp. MWU13-2517]